MHLVAIAVAIAIAIAIASRGLMSNEVRGISHTASFKVVGKVVRSELAFDCLSIVPTSFQPQSLIVKFQNVQTGAPAGDVTELFGVRSDNQ